MARARGERTQLAGAFETTEKTAPASGYTLLDHSRNSLALTRALIEHDLVGSRDDGDHGIDVSTVSGDVQIPLDVRGVGWWLKLLLGAPTTTANTGVYTHVYQSGAWSLPSASLEAQKPDVPSFEMFSGVRADRMRVGLQRGGWANATVSVVGQSAATPTTATTAGTPSRFTLSRFVNPQGKIQIDGVDTADVVQADWDYSNNLDQVDTVTADGFIGGLDPMRATMSIGLRTRFASEALFTKAKAGTPVALSMVYEIDADNSLTLAMPRVFLDVTGRPVEGPGGIEASFSARASLAANGDPMLTATLVNDVDTY